VTFDLSSNEVELLNAYQLLTSGGQRELKDFLRYLLCKQYRREVMAAVFNNNLLSNLFHSLLHIIEGDEFDINLVSKRIRQIKDLYYALFQKVHFRYNEVVENLDSNEAVREFGKAFDNLERALCTGNETIIRMEVIEFYQQYLCFSQKKENRKIVAV
jgi:hypothetical protein